MSAIKHINLTTLTLGEHSAPGVTMEQLRGHLLDYIQAMKLKPEDRASNFGMITRGGKRIGKLDFEGNKL